MRESLQDLFLTAVSEIDITAAKSLVFRCGKEIDPNYGSREDGSTALMSACLNNDSATTRLLLDFFSGGIQINTQNNNGETALFCAVKSQNLQIVKLLVENFRSKIDINATDNIGNTAPLCAYLNQQEQILAYLMLQFRDDVALFATNNSGVCLLAHACETGALPMLTAIVEACHTRIDLHSPLMGTTLLEIAKRSNQKATLLYLLQQCTHSSAAQSLSSYTDAIALSPHKILAHVSVPARRATYGLSVAESRQKALPLPLPAPSETDSLSQCNRRNTHTRRVLFSVEKRKRGWAEAQDEDDPLPAALADTPSAARSPIHTRDAAQAATHSPKRSKTDDSLSLPLAVSAAQPPSSSSAARPHSASHTTPSRALFLSDGENESERERELRAQLADCERALSAWKSRAMLTPQKRHSLRDTPGRRERACPRECCVREILCECVQDEVLRLRAQAELRSREKVLHQSELEEEREKALSLTKDLQRREDEIAALREELLHTKERERELDIALGNRDVQALCEESECERFVDEIDRLRALILQRKKDIAAEEKRKSAKLSREDKQCVVS